MQEDGQVYFDLREHIPEEDIKRHEEAMERHRARMEKFLKPEAAERLEKLLLAEEERALLHGS